jgi:prevent-host-death family protein
MLVSPRRGRNLLALRGKADLAPSGIGQTSALAVLRHQRQMAPERGISRAKYLRPQRPLFLRTLGQHVIVVHLAMSFSQFGRGAEAILIAIQIRCLNHMQQLTCLKKAILIALCSKEKKHMRFTNTVDLKNKTDELLREVMKRGLVGITYPGKPAAALAPLSEDDLEHFVLKHTPRIKKMIAEAEKGRYEERENRNSDPGGEIQ